MPDDPPTTRLSARQRRKLLKGQLQQDVVHVPTYRDRTVPVGRFAAWRWARKWVPIAIALIVVLVGPFGGGWYYFRQRDARESQRLRAMLYTEVEGNVSTIDAQIRSLTALEASLGARQPDQVPALSPSFETVRWAQVAPRADLFPNDDVFRQFADLYRGLGALDAQFSAYHDARTVWQWASRESDSARASAMQVLMDAASELRSSLTSQRTAAQTLLSQVRPGMPVPSGSRAPDAPARDAGTR